MDEKPVSQTEQPGFGEFLLNARKAGGYILVSDEQLMDAGMIPDTRAPYPLSWRMRVRLKVALWRIRLGEIIAGQRFGEDY